MDVKMMKLHDIVPYENNPRNNQGAIEYLANSIKEFGFKVPIVVDKNNTIVAGHTRWLAADSLNMDEVPVVVADDLTEEQVRAYRLVDNKTAEISTWDYSKLAEEIDALSFDFTDFGFGELELDVLKNGNDFADDLLDGEMEATQIKEDDGMRTIVIKAAEEELEGIEFILKDAGIEYKVK